jgi:hypothetical protein
MYQKLKHWLKSLKQELSSSVDKFKEMTADVVSEPGYELVILDNFTRFTQKKKFSNIKEAMAYAKPYLEIYKSHDFLLFNTSIPSNPFIRLNSKNESNNDSRIVQARKKLGKVLHFEPVSSSKRHRGTISKSQA